MLSIKAYKAKFLKMEYTMKNFLATLLLLTSFTSGAYAANPQVVMTTNLGVITIELDADKAPKSVGNFLNYVQQGFYNGTVFHRVISNFMVQGGGFTADFQKKPTNAPIMNEANNGLKNTKGTLAMARTSDPHSATAQFFINVKDNDFLDHSAPTPRGWGYAVFGKVIKGMNVVEKIRNVDTGSKGPFRQDVPQTTIVIEKVEVVGLTPPAPTSIKAN